MTNDPSPILILGAGGMLGRAWKALLDQRRMTYDAPSKTEFDLTRLEDVHRGLSDRYDTVVNCAAWTDVDGAESQPEAANDVNGTAVGQLAQRCAATDTRLIHYSTDYVFDGQADRPYPVDHPVNPVNAYGQSKLLGERRVKESGCRHLLIRTSWLYAPWGNNFVRTISKLAAQRSVLKVVDDQRGRPTSVEHLARVSLDLVQKNLTGLYHVTDGGECTWFEFAQAVAKRVNPRCQIEPCSSEQFPRPARRPTYSVLALSRVEAACGPMADWQKNLSAVFDQLLPEALL